MKKLFIVLAFFTGIVSFVNAQNRTNSLDPTSSISVQEVNKANGTAQPVMKDGKTYLQWVSEQKLKQLSTSDAGRVVAISVPVKLNSTNDRPVVVTSNLKTTTENSGLTGNVSNPGTQDPSAKQSPANNTPAKPEEIVRPTNESSRSTEPAKKD